MENTFNQTAEGMLWSLHKEPTISEIEEAQRKLESQGKVAVSINYDHFPTSTGELDLSYLKIVPPITSLQLNYVAGLKNLNFLADLPNLESLTIAPTKTKKLDLSPLAALTQLKMLSLDTQQHGIDVLSRLESLNELHLRSLSLTALPSLARCVNLTRLWIGLGTISDLSSLSQTGIRWLELWQISKFSDESLAAIANAKSLEVVVLENLKHISSLPDLSKVTNLRRIELTSLSSFNTIDTLLTAPNLEEVVICGCDSLTSEEVLKLKTHPRLRAASISFKSKKLTDEATAALNLPRANPRFFSA